MKRHADLGICRIVRIALLLAMALVVFPVTGRAELPNRKYGSTFTWSDSDTNTIWMCAPYKNKNDEAVVYGCENANIDIRIPDHVYQGSKGYKVTGVVSPDEISLSEGNYSASYMKRTFIYEPKVSAYALANIVFPDTVSLIGQNAFAGDPLEGEGAGSSLQGVYLPQNPLLVIEEAAFSNCYTLKEVVFTTTSVAKTAQPVEIQADAFKNCSGLKTITFPLKSEVDEEAFTGCFGLEEVYNIPYRLDLGRRFEDDEGGPAKVALKKVTFAKGSTVIGGVGVGLGVKKGGSSGYTVEADTIPGLTEISIPAGVKEIDENAFKGLRSLTSVHLPEGLTAIDFAAFQDCTALKSINLPASLQKIGEHAFDNCSKLTGITKLPAGVQEPGDYAFYGCRNLRLSVSCKNNLAHQFMNSGITDITVTRSDPTNVFFVGGLTGCPNLTSIIVKNGASGDAQSKNGVLYASATYAAKHGDLILKVPAAMNAGGKYMIPTTVKGLGGLAFNGCRMKEIVIPTDCKNFLADDSISDGTKANFAFDNMACACTIYYDKDVLSASMIADIKGWGNVGGKKIAHTWVAQDRGTAKKKEEQSPTSGTESDTDKSVAAGDTVKTSTAKYQVSKVAGKKAGSVVLIAPVNKSAKTLKVPDTITIDGKKYKVTRIGKSAFSKMKKLKKVTVGKNVEWIEDKAFYGCLKLATVTFAKNTVLDEIGTSTFANCKSLKKITIPAKVVTIGKKAFSGDKKLKKITVKSKNVIVVEKNAFKGIAAKAVIKVPKSKLKAYKKLFKNKGQGKKVKISK